MKLTLASVLLTVLTFCCAANTSLARQAAANPATERQVQEFFKDMENPNRQLRAIDSAIDLLSVDARVRDKLLELLDDPEPRVRIRAAVVLAKSGTWNSAIAESLRAEMKMHIEGTIYNDDSGRRPYEMYYLPSLVRALDKSELAQLAPELILFTGDGHLDFLSSEMTYGILQLDTIPTEFLDPAIALLGFEQSGARVFGAQLLERLGIHNSRAVEMLQLLLIDLDPEVREHAVAALAAIAPDDPEIASKCFQTCLALYSPADHLFVSQSPSQSELGIRSLSRFARFDEEWAFQLAPILDEWMSERQVVALAQLIRAHPESTRPLLQVLQSGLKRDSNPARVNVARASALIKLGYGESFEYVLLIGCLHDDSASVRSAAAHELGEIGAPAKRAIADLQLLLRDPTEHVRHAAMLAIQKIDPGALELPAPSSVPPRNAVVIPQSS